MTTLLTLAIICFCFYFLTMAGKPRAWADRVRFLRLGSLYCFFALLVVFSLIEAIAENGVLYGLWVSCIPATLALIIGIYRFEPDQGGVRKAA